MRKPKIVTLLDDLERKLGAADHDVFFHLREIALDLVRHHASLADIDARLAAGKLDRKGALRALEDLRTEFTAATLVHWEYHLDELEKDLRRRLRVPRRRRALDRTATRSPAARSRSR
jgi:hypothetical protein